MPTLVRVLPSAPWERESPDSLRRFCLCPQRPPSRLPAGGGSVADGQAAP
jgi:hypothetical protein